MNSFTIEVVATSVQSCIAAQTGGARRIELCSALATAGVTPSSALIQLAKQYVTIPIYVMIRPREGNFCYDRIELEVIKRDIENAKIMGADGIVLGVLNDDGTVNVKGTKKLVELSLPLPVTFHRAIDITPDIEDALEAIIDTGCTMVLTSGGKATGPEGIEVISQLADQADGRIRIMPGGGIRPETFPQMLHPKIFDYHLSGRTPVTSSYQTDLFDMNYAETDSAAIKTVVDRAKKYFFSE
jgi:copper homeostasis protein